VWTCDAVRLWSASSSYGFTLPSRSLKRSSRSASVLGGVVVQRATQTPDTFSLPLKHINRVNPFSSLQRELLFHYVNNFNKNIVSISPTDTCLTQTGRRKPELQSWWNGNGPNSANAPTQFVVQILWNGLPPAVRNIDSHPAFRRALKSHLFYCTFIMVARKATIILRRVYFLFFLSLHFLRHRKTDTPETFPHNVA